MQGQLRSSGAMGAGRPAPLHESLARAASGDAELLEAAQTLAFYQDEQARLTEEMLERESWSLTAILSALEPVWPQLATDTLRFIPDLPLAPCPWHLELGRFPHLAALLAPSEGERALMACRALCWARVYVYEERKNAGQTGALAYSYVPISTGEAIATLGLARILEVIAAASAGAGRALAAKQQLLGERQERLLRVESMLGWTPHPAEAGTAQAPLGRRLLCGLLRLEFGPVHAGAALLVVGLAVPLFYLGGLIGLLLLAALTCAVVLTAWVGLSSS